MSTSVPNNPDSVALYIPQLTAHVEDFKESEFEKAVAEIGNVQVSLPFLKDGCNDHVLKPTENGKQRKCIAIRVSTRFN